MNLNPILRYRLLGVVAVLAFGIVVLLGSVLWVSGCPEDDQQTATQSVDAATSVPGAVGTIEEAPERLVLMTHDSFAVSEDVLAAFDAETGTEVDVLRAGDAGAMLNQAILTKDNPLGDVLYGVDSTFFSRALAEDLFIPYESPLLARVPADLQLDPEHRLTPVDYGDVALNYDKERFRGELGPPESLDDLTRSDYKGMLVVENPATSSPGLAFMLATIVEYGESGEYTWLDFWGDLVANDVLVTSGWEEAYYAAFSGGSGEGDRPLVVSYASSPPAEVVFADPPPEEAPTGVILAGAFRQIEFAGILAGTEYPEAAGSLVDFMLSTPFQEDIPLNMFVFPVNEDAQLPPVFVKHTVIPPEPATMDPARIDENRERWIEEWTAAVLG